MFEALWNVDFTHPTAFDEYATYQDQNGNWEGVKAE
jgi:hypothetical protein